MTAPKVLSSLLIAGVLSFQAPGRSESADSPTSASTVQKILPPAKGMYLGQTTFGGNEVATLEEATGKKLAIVIDPTLVTGQEEVAEGELSFDIEKARGYWRNGYVIAVAAYEAYPGHRPFTVDNLIRGKYDEELRKLAGQFREFGKPMFFMTAREPNGVLAPYMGGFGRKGDMSVGWAMTNEKGFVEFVPPAGPPGNPDLFAGLGDPTINDGLERLAAAQRYYYDFFIRREGLTFLTFESMGWVVMPPMSSDDPPQGSYERKLIESSSFEVLYSLIKDYTDWISINWYIATHPEEEGPDEPPGPIRPIRDFTQSLSQFLPHLDSIAPGKPVLITELGFPPPNAREKVETGLNLLMKHENIKAFAMWVGSCQIRPGTPEGDAFKELVAENPDSFHSFVRFSDGTSAGNPQ